jgi:hypothetical protein
MKHVEPMKQELYTNILMLIRLQLILIAYFLFIFNSTT